MGLEFLSLSADDETQVVTEDSLQASVVNAVTPVRLPADVMDKFVKGVFPVKQKGSKDPYELQRRFVFDKLAWYIAGTSARIHYMFSLLSYIVEQAELLETRAAEGNEDIWNVSIPSACKTMQQRIDTGPNTREIKAAMMGAMTRTPTMIVPSKTHAGGFDLFIEGIPEHKVSGGLDIFNSNRASKITALATSGYEGDVIYGSDTAQRALKAARLAQDYLFGEVSDVSSVTGPIRRSTLPLTFDFEALNDILGTVHPSLRRLNLFVNLDKRLVENVDQFFLFSLRPYFDSHTVDKNLVKRLKSNPTLMPLTDEYLACAVRATMGLCLSLDKEIVHFVTQGQEEVSPYLMLTRWFKAWRSYYMRVKGLSGGANAINRRSNLPLCATAASGFDSVRDVRAKAGLAVYKDLSHGDGFVVTPKGFLAVLPKVEDIAKEDVIEIERQSNKVLEQLYSMGVPYMEVDSDPVTGAVEAANADVEDLSSAVIEVRKGLNRFNSVLTGVDYNSGVLVTTQEADPIATRANVTLGAKAPNQVDLADYLGFDFADPGQSPNYRPGSLVVCRQSESFPIPIDRTAALMKEVGGLVQRGSGRIAVSFDDRTRSENEKDTKQQVESKFVNAFAAIAYFYQKLVDRKLIPNIGQFVRDAAAVRLITGLSEDPYDKGIYTPAMQDNLTLSAGSDGALALALMISAMNDAGGYAGSNLVAEMYKQFGSPTSARAEMTASDRYYDPITSPFSNMCHVAEYLGGAVFRSICEAIFDLDRRKLFSVLSEDETMPSALCVCNTILPLCGMISKLATKDKFPQIFKDAEDEIERGRPDTSIDADSIKIPGSKAGFTFMPHQMGAHQVLRKRPKYAILDIEPGGGKTLIGLTDIMCCIAESSVPIKPIVLAPNRLVANWCEDLAKVSDQWNVIPITMDALDDWGEDRLVELLSGAPRNTIYVVALGFTTGRKLRIEIGGVRVTISSTCEFLGRFGFNYILMDESHKAKNLSSGVHQRVKQVFSMPNIEFARIATGTLIMDRVRDAVGQAALLTPATFGDDVGLEEFSSEDSAETISKVRSRLGNHVAMISYKRKNWAFMLPNPIDTFINVKIDDPSVPGSEYHAELYEAAYRQLLDMIASATANAKSKTSSVAKEKDEDEDEDDGDIEGSSDTEDSIGMEDEGDDDELTQAIVGSQEIENHLAAMEMLLTDPMSDEASAALFKAAGYPNFVSAKLTAIIERISKHFEHQPARNPEVNEHQIYTWKKGVIPRELDLAEHEGLLYMARKKSTDYKRQMLPASEIPPSEDPENWKMEVQGKLIVFTRYTRNCDAVYNALPEKYKRIAVRFHGRLGDSGESADVNLDKFKNDPKCQILIANEQAISEGHNLQSGSRIVRCDTPWSPGVYEQSTARIFRPDVSAAQLDDNGKPGDLPREVVFIDWVMTEGTLEVGKVARLMWKTVDKVRFDEHGNTRYDVLNDYSLEPIRMNAEFLLSNNTIEDYKEYFLAKRDMNEIQAQEFSEMRRSTASRMVEIPETPMTIAGARILESVPITNGQKINDRTPFGLVRFSDWLGAHKLKGVTRDAMKNTLNMLPVYTEFGNGVIVGVNFTRSTLKNADNQPLINPDTPISSVKVRLNGSDEMITVNYRRLFVATNVTPKDFDRFFKSRKAWATDKDRKRIEAKAKIDDVATAKEVDVQITTDTTIAEVVAEVKVAEDVKEKRRENKKEELPINTGVEEIRRKPKIPAVVDGAISRVPTAAVADATTVKPKPGVGRVQVLDQMDGLDQTLTLIPTVFNNFVALYADSDDPDTVGLNKFKFNKFGDYAYVDCFYAEEFNSILDFLEDNFKLDAASEERLSDIQDGFKTTQGRVSFDSRVAVQRLGSNLVNFFQTKKLAAKNKQTVKVYPMVIETGLRLMIDLKESPAVVPFMGRKIAKGKGTNGKLLRHVGMNIFFAGTVTEAKKKMNELIKAGYKISNVAKTTAALDDLKLYQFREKKPAK